jgi:hypothetical protein
MSGWGSISKNANPKVSIFSGGGDSSMGSGTEEELRVTFGVVNNINYDPGTLHGFISYNSIDGDRNGQAAPLNPNSTSYPIEGEVVLIINASSIRDGNLTNDKANYLKDTNANFYISSLNIWNNPSINCITNPLSYFPSNRVTNIQPLSILPGDTLFQGRFGNAIRLGSSNESINTEWTDSKNSGDPITIISNGNQSNRESTTTTLSSIYLTSFQRLNNLTLANQSFQAYKREDEPIFPREYQSPQILLNSDRIVLNAKADSVLISGEKSIGLSTNNSINIESRKIYMNGADIRIGSPNASQPALLGNETVDLLIRLTEQVQYLAKIASTSQIWPGGVPAPDGTSNTIGINIDSVCETLLNKLKSEKRGIKSNFIRLK